MPKYLNVSATQRVDYIIEATFNHTWRLAKFITRIPHKLASTHKIHTHTHSCKHTHAYYIHMSSNWSGQLLTICWTHQFSSLFLIYRYSLLRLLSLTLHPPHTLLGQLHACSICDIRTRVRAWYLLIPHTQTHIHTYAHTHLHMETFTLSVSICLMIATTWLMCLWIPYKMGYVCLRGRSAGVRIHMYLCTTI